MEFDELRNLLKRDRSIRRFHEQKEIGEEKLRQLVELVRYCASGRNLQPLKYRIVVEKEERDAVFPLLAWAGYLHDWDGPIPGERPSAYLVQCLDSRLTKNCLCDDGIQLQAITLGATAMGLGGCIIKSFQAGPLKEALVLPEWAQPLYVLALGFPAEKVMLEPFKEDVLYYRTSDGVHHVPKRLTKDLLI